MSPEERVMAVAGFGFTRRQARFLDIVMRHSGVCLLRQYATFAGIVHGQKTRAFFAKLVRRGFASASACRHNRGRIYHVHHGPLYGAIGEPHSRYRRPVAASRTSERLTLLDALLGAADITWLAPGAETRHHLASPSPGVTEAPPGDGGGRFTGDRGLCSDIERIGIDRTGRTVLLRLVVPFGQDDFRKVLNGYSAVLSRLPAWTLRLVFPRHLATAYEGYQRVIREEWETPLHLHTLDELMWYFGQRRTVPRGHFPLPVDERFARAEIAFQSPRFDRLYRRWLRWGSAGLTDATSRAMSEALGSGSGRVECITLNHAYDHLSPVLETTGPASLRASIDTDETIPSASPALDAVFSG